MNNSGKNRYISEHTYQTYQSGCNIHSGSSAYIRIEQRRRRIKARRRTSIAALVCIAFMITFLSAVIVEAADSTNARRSNSASDVRYYTSISIEKDDTLWSIAGEHAPEGVSISHYVNDIRSINNLHNDNITAGRNLIIYYYAHE